MTPLRAREIGWVLDELRPRVVGARLTKILPRGASDLLLELRPGTALWLVVLSVHPEASRIALADEASRPRPAAPPRGGAQRRLAPFVQLARRELEGRWLVSLLQPDGDRLVALGFAARRPAPGSAHEAEPGAAPGTAPGTGTASRADRWLLAELTGRHANLFVATASEDGTGFGRVLGSFYPSRSTRRDLRPGRPYVPPLPRPAGVTASPGPAPGSDAPAPTGTPEQAPAPTERFDPAEGRVAERVEAYFAAQLAAARLQRLRTTVEQRLRRELARTRRRVEAVSGDLARLERGDEDRRKGELLLAHLGEIARGATGVVLPELGATEPTVVIALDPALGPRENAERYFRRYRKARQGLHIARERLEAARAEAERLAAELGRVATLGPDALGRLARRIGVDPDAEAAAGRRLTARQQARERGRASELERALPYRQFVARGGEAILVGKGAHENDELTFKHARGNDLWLHTRDAPGAHVVLRPLPGRTEPHPESLLDAAVLAAHHSSLKKEAQVDVTVTRAKHVRKAKGAPPGTVYVSASRTVRVRMEPGRLRRLLGGSEESGPIEPAE